MQNASVPAVPAGGTRIVLLIVSGDRVISCDRVVSCTRVAGKTVSGASVVFSIEDGWVEWITSVHQSKLVENSLVQFLTG